MNPIKSPSSEPAAIGIAEALAKTLGNKKTIHSKFKSVNIVN